MIDNFFKFKENGTDFKTEILAGITTFLAMAYILGVNPVILGDGGLPITGVFFATAVASGVACIIMGLVSKYPVGLAPGMGLNALFTYTIILEMGNSWETALAAVFISSIIFLIITISGLREAILNAIPLDLKLGIGGVIITLILYVRKVPAAVFFGLVITAIIGVIFTAFGFGKGDIMMPAIPAQFITTNFDFSLFGGFVRGFGSLLNNIPNLIMMLFSLVFVTFFDTTGTLMALGRQCGFIDEEGQAVGIENAFLADAVGGIVGSVFGTSTVTAYVESAAGIGIGGKTGLAAVVTGILFILSIFFAPLVLGLFTSPVTCAALVIVGILMITQLKEVEWDNIIVAASVFMTIIMMILTYSISLGIAWGFVVYAVASVSSGKAKELGWSIWLMVIIFVIYLFFGL